MSIPPTTEGSACSRNRNRVATPKFPPPPRIAQNRSGSFSASTRRSSPSAVTMSAASRSSIVRPCLRTRNPMPPPSVIPPIPTEPVSPNPVASPSAAGRLGVLGGGQSRLGPRRPLVLVDVDPSHVGEVEHDPALGNAVAGAAVTAAADRQLQARLARVRDDACNVGSIGDTHDHRRTAIEPTREHGSGAVIAGVIRPDHPSVDRRAEILERDGAAVGGGLLHGELLSHANGTQEGLPRAAKLIGPERDGPAVVLTYPSGASSAFFPSEGEQEQVHHPERGGVRAERRAPPRVADDRDLASLHRPVERLGDDAGADPLQLPLVQLRLAKDVEPERRVP